MKSIRTPLSELEEGLARKIAGARFPPGTASKRFAVDMADGRIKGLSSKGRKFMAYIAHRFRRQYALTADEIRWIREWIGYQEPVVEKPVVKQEPVVVEDKPQLDLWR